MYDEKDADRLKERETEEPLELTNGEGSGVLESDPVPVVNMESDPIPEVASAARMIHRIRLTIMAPQSYAPNRG